MTKKLSPFHQYINQWVAFSRRGKTVKVVASAPTAKDLHRKIKDQSLGQLSVMNIPSPDFKYSL